MGGGIHCTGAIRQTKALKMGFLGSLFSNSPSSSSSSPTTNVDGRQSIGDGAIAVNATSGSTANANITLTDFGSVSKSLDLAMKGIDSLTGMAQQQVSSAGAATAGAQSLVSGALSSMASQQQQLAATVENAKTGDSRPLMYAALAVVGLTALAFIAKKA